MIAQFEAYYGYDIDDEIENEGDVAELLASLEVEADCGDLLYCRDFLLLPDYDTNTIGIVVKPSGGHQLEAYLDTRAYFLEDAKHKVLNYFHFETRYMS